MDVIQQKVKEREGLKEDEIYNDEVSAVYKTNDYKLFESISGNRIINALHLSRLKKSMKEKYLRIPIIVNSKFQIIDGQHRFLNCLELGLPVYYIINKNYDLQDVQRLNSNMSNWGMNDYMQGYCKMGKLDYIKYREYKNKYGFSHAEMRGMLTGSSSKNTSPEFKDGLFQITHEEKFLEQARKIATMKEFYEGYRRRSFVSAMLALFRNEKFDMDIFLKRLPHQRSKLIDLNSKKDYLEVIEDIYNYKSKNPQFLRNSK